MRKLAPYILTLFFFGLTNVALANQQSESDKQTAMHEPQGQAKKDKAEKYSFTLFKFFDQKSTSESDSTSLNPQRKEEEEKMISGKPTT